MCRLRSPRTAWIALVLLAYASLAAAEGPTSRPKRPAAPAASSGKAQLSIPGFWALALEPVQKELGITADQKKQLWGISDNFQAKAMEAAAGMEHMSAEEQKRRYESLLEQARKDTAGVRHQVLAALTSQQLHSYQRIEFRLRVATGMSEPRLLKALELTDYQKAKLVQVREAMEQRMEQVYEESADKVLDLLTPSQREKLQDEFDKQQGP